MNLSSISETYAALDSDGFVIVRSLSVAAAAATLAQQLGPVLDTTQVRLSDKPTYLASPDSIPPHTDHPAAKLILWYCNREDGNGAGANLLTDMRTVIQRLPAVVVEQMGNVRMPCPEIFGIEPTDTYPLYNAATKQVFYAPWLCKAARCDALTAFEREIYRPAHQRRIMLKAGDVLLIDNHRMLHYRDTLIPTSRRWLTRYWIGS